VSRELRQHLIEEGFSQKRAGVIYNGIDVGPLPGPRQRDEIRQLLRVEQDTLVIGTIARLDPVKDLGTLINATALLGNTPTLLIIIGDGSESASLREQAAAAGVADRVRFLGHRDDARAWLAGCDIYVNSSISEGVSLTILEAMAAGVPVIATRVGGTPEVVDAGSGRLVPPRDAQSLAAVLAELHADAAGRLELGTSARRRVEEHFTLERMVSEYRRVYERLG